VSTIRSSPIAGSFCFQDSRLTANPFELARRFFCVGQDQSIITTTIVAFEFVTRRPQPQVVSAPISVSGLTSANGPRGTRVELQTRVVNSGTPG